MNLQNFQNIFIHTSEALVCFSINGIIPVNSEAFFHLLYVSEFFHQCFQVCLMLTVHIFLFKVNNGHTQAMCEICPKLTIKTPELH